MKISFDKKIHGLPPLDLVDSARQLQSFSGSVRQAENLFRAGRECIERYNLYLPYVHYRAKLEYFDSSDLARAVVSYARFANWGNIVDTMQVAIIGDEESSIIEVDRGLSSRTFFRRVPVKVTTKVIRPDQIPAERTSSYNLLR